MITQEAEQPQFKPKFENWFLLGFYMFLCRIAYFFSRQDTGQKLLEALEAGNLKEAYFYASFKNKMPDITKEIDYVYKAIEENDSLLFEIIAKSGADLDYCGNASYFLEEFNRDPDSIESFAEPYRTERRKLIEFGKSDKKDKHIFNIVTKKRRDFVLEIRLLEAKENLTDQERLKLNNLKIEAEKTKKIIEILDKGHPDRCKDTPIGIYHFPDRPTDAAIYPRYYAFEIEDKPIIEIYSKNWIKHNPRLISFNYRLTDYLNDHIDNDFKFYYKLLKKGPSEGDNLIQGRILAKCPKSALKIFNILTEGKLYKHQIKDSSHKETVQKICDSNIIEWIKTYFTDKTKLDNREYYAEFAIRLHLLNIKDITHSKNISTNFDYNEPFLYYVNPSLVTSYLASLPKVENDPFYERKQTLLKSSKVVSNVTKILRSMRGYISQDKALAKDALTLLCSVASEKNINFETTKVLCGLIIAQDKHLSGINKTEFSIELQNLLNNNSIYALVQYFVDGKDLPSYQIENKKKVEDEFKNIYDNFYTRCLDKKESHKDRLIKEVTQTPRLEFLKA